MTTGIIANGTSAPGASFTYTPSSNGKVNVSLVSTQNGATFAINNLTAWIGAGSFTETQFSFYVSGGTTYTFTTSYVYYLVSAIEEVS